MDLQAQQVPLVPHQQFQVLSVLLVQPDLVEQRLDLLVLLVQPDRKECLVQLGLRELLVLLVLPDLLVRLETSVLQALQVPLEILDQQGPLDLLLMYLAL